MGPAWVRDPGRFNKINFTPMARKNKLGTSFCNLDLEKDEEKKLRQYLKDEDKSAKSLLRKLVREFLKTTK